MFKASHDFIILSLDRSRAVDKHLDEDQPATVLSALDHYVARPATAQFKSMTLLCFVQQYTVPMSHPREENVVIIVRLYYSPDPHGPNYEQYCQQKLLLHVPFCHRSELLSDNTTFTAAYANFLQSGNISSSLEDDIHRLQELSQ